MGSAIRLFIKFIGGGGMGGGGAGGLLMGQLSVKSSI